MGKIYEKKKNKPHVQLIFHARMHALVATPQRVYQNAAAIVIRLILASYRRS